MSSGWRRFPAAPRFAPIAGLLIGAAGAIVFWISTQMWPASIGVVLAMLIMTVLAGRNAMAEFGTVGVIFALLAKYNALMALSGASLPYRLPANTALGLIMMAALAASRALAISVRPVAHVELALALSLGFAPALLLGLPGLIGLAAAIAALLLVMTASRLSRMRRAVENLRIIEEITEICFYLGALAAWAYI